jgi:hypothetical protein
MRTLPEEDRPTRIELDEYRDDYEYGREQDETDYRGGEIERTLQQARRSRQPRHRQPDERHTLDVYSRAFVPSTPAWLSPCRV